MQPRTEVPENNIDGKTPKETQSVLLERCLEEGVEVSQGESSGLVILEDTDHRIHVAVHAGDRYTRAVEAAAVRVDIDPDTDASAARITELRAADFAEGTSAKAEALDLVQKLAKQHGARSLVFERSRDEWEKLRLRERQTLFRELRDEGFTIRYATEANEKIRCWTLEPDASTEESTDVRDIVHFEAKKELATERPQQVDLSQPHADQLRTELIGAAEGGEVPERLHLPPEVSAKMEDMWKRSIREEPNAVDPVREYGALLVDDETDEIMISDIVRGTKDSVMLPNPGEGETKIGHVHTHPYESGLTDMSFSGGDFAALMGDDEARISIVRSGDSIFALVKTGKTPTITSEEQLVEVAEEIDEDYGNALRDLAEDRPAGRPTFSDFQTAAVAAGIRAARRYRLHLYHGDAGEPMRRIS